MGDYTIAYILIGVIGFVMLFCFLKMHEYLKNIDEKMTKTNQMLEKINDKMSKE